MMFSLCLTIVHPGIPDPISHVDMLHGESRAAVLGSLKLSNKIRCDLKNKGVARWKDQNGANHKLELKIEAN